MSKKKTFRRWLWCAAAVLLCAFILWNNCALTVERVTVGAPIEKSLRIVQLSDLHGAWFGFGQAQLTAHVWEESPDVIVLTGDLIDKNHDERAAVVLMEELTKIAPVYCVVGNHEYKESRTDKGAYERLLQAMEQTENVHLLRGETVAIAEDVTLTGADELYFVGGLDDYPAYIERLGTQTDGRYNILLAHRPIYFEDYAKAGFELTLAGHVHGGQFRLPWVGGVFTPDEGLFPEYDFGLYTREDGAKMYINRGLGNSGFPLRLFNRPEITVIEMVAE